MAKTNRTILTTNDQSMGDIGNPDKLETMVTHAYDQIDANDDEFIAHKNKAVDPASSDEVKDKHVSNNDLKTINENLNTHKTSSDHDGRYYTKTEIDSPTRDHEGTWQGLTPGQASEAINGARLDVVEASLNGTNLQPTTLSHGLQTIVSDQDTPLWIKKIVGRTLVNLLGRDGNCGDVSKWTAISSTMVLDSTNKTQGSNGIVATTSDQVVGAVYSRSIPVKGTSYYIFIGDVRNIDTTDVRLVVTRGSNPTSGLPITGQLHRANSGTVFKTVYMKVSPTDIGAEASLIAYIQGTGATTGKKFAFDSIRVYEITQAEYNALATMTTEQIAAKYPYVDDVKGLQGVYVETGGHYVYLPTILHSSLDGSVADTYENGKVTRRFRELTLDGSLVPTFSSDQAGYKSISINIGVASTGVNNSDNIRVIKYDGKILETNGLLGASDRVAINTTDKVTITITIPDTDSGLGEAWVGTTLTKATYTLLTRDTTSSDIMKALMNGWKIINFGTPASTQWQGIVSGTTTADTDKVIHTRDEGYIPGRLIYQLASVVSEEIQPIGDVMLTEGNNTVTLGEGLVQREPVIPLINNAGVYYGINSLLPFASGGYGINPLKNIPKSVMGVNKNGLIDPQWIITSGSVSNWYGGVAVYIEKSKFDPNAVYTLDYIAEGYSHTSSINHLDVEYSKRIRTTVNELVKAKAELDKRVDFLETLKANKAQLGWIPLALLNGATNYSASFNLAGCRKDQFNTVKLRGVLSGFVSGSVISYLPYKPAKIAALSALSYNGTTYQPVEVIIETDGSLKIYNLVASGRVYLDELEYSLD